MRGEVAGVRCGVGCEGELFRFISGLGTSFPAVPLSHLDC